jgi:hypothetical protein
MPEPADKDAVNPYASPRSTVADPDPGAGAQPVFFPVGTIKLAIMSLATLGLYQLYWSYRNWKSVQRLTGDKLSAPLRALFYPLTSYFLFKRMRNEARGLHQDLAISAGPLAIAVLVLTLLWRLPDPYWLVSLLAFVPFLPVQSQVNQLNQKLASAADANSRLRGWNIVAIFVGGLVLALAVVGLLLGEE